MMMVKEKWKAKRLLKIRICVLIKRQSLAKGIAFFFEFNDGFVFLFLFIKAQALYLVTQINRFVYKYS